MFKQPGPPAPGACKVVNYTLLTNNDEVTIVQNDTEPNSGLWVSSGKDTQTFTITVHNGKYTVLIPPTEMLGAPGVFTPLSGKLSDL